MLYSVRKPAKGLRGMIEGDTISAAADLRDAKEGRPLFFYTGWGASPAGPHPTRPLYNVPRALSPPIFPTPRMNFVRTNFVRQFFFFFSYRTNFVRFLGRGNTASSFVYVWIFYRIGGIEFLMEFFYVPFLNVLCVLSLLRKYLKPFFKRRQKATTFYGQVYGWNYGENISENTARTCKGCPD